MEWTPEYRLKLIEDLARNVFEGNRLNESLMELMRRVIFLCSSTDEFLEANKQNYEDVIDTPFN